MNTQRLKIEMARHISFRPVRLDDDEFLFRLFASTRTDVIAANADEAVKARFLRSQFCAQQADFQTRFSEAEFLIVLLGYTPVGRLYLLRGPVEVRLIDIALLPEYRDQGIGTRLLTDILHEANEVRKPVRLHVKKQNRALTWYQRLGFVEIGEVATHFLMEWRPSKLRRPKFTEQCLSY